MRIEGTLVEGRFVARDNRFRVTVEVGCKRVSAHLPNSGRLGELLVPGRRAILVKKSAARRKTGYDLSLVEHQGRWISVDARMPNDLVEEALRTGRIEPLDKYPELHREVIFGHSRFDFLLESPQRPPCLVEVKSITLVIDGLGCFPDAVTARGRRHVNELMQAVAEGYRAAVLFCVQREDVGGMRPHDESDPAFGEALRKAVAQGVEVYAFACRVEPGEVEIAQRLPVYLQAPAKVRIELQHSPTRPAC